MLSGMALLQSGGCSENKAWPSSVPLGKNTQFKKVNSLLQGGWNQSLLSDF